MTEEEKELLVKDLCARLPYGVFCEINDADEPCKLETIELNGDYFLFNNGVSERYITEIKPYLRPMSSMTEEEEIRGSGYASPDDYGRLASYDEKIPEYIDWLNSHHFDYRDLIKKGLALEAPKDMYI